MVTPITSDEEIIEIEIALEQPFKTVSHHIKQALQLLSDRENPNYHASIHQSVSAVESLLDTFVPDKDVEKALKTLETQGRIFANPVFRKALSQLYIFTSDADGLRHAGEGLAAVSKEEARYMVIVCSAFVNYLIAKEGKVVMAG